MTELFTIETVRGLTTPAAMLEGALVSILSGIRVEGTSRKSLGLFSVLDVLYRYTSPIEDDIVYNQGHFYQVVAQRLSGARLLKNLKDDGIHLSPSNVNLAVLARKVLKEH